MGVPDQAFDDASISLYAKGSRPNKSQILPKYWQDEFTHSIIKSRHPHRLYTVDGHGL